MPDRCPRKPGIIFGSFFLQGFSSCSFYAQRTMTTLSLIARRTRWAGGTPASVAASPPVLFLQRRPAALAHRKPVRIVVGFPGGSSPDLTARTFSEPCPNYWASQSLWKTKWGLAAILAPPSGPRPRQPYDWFDDQWQYEPIAKNLNPATPYDPLKDLAPLTLIGVSPLVLTAPVEQPGVPKDADAQSFFAAAQSG